MSWQANPKIIRLRAKARDYGLTQLLARILPYRGYEEKFDAAIFEAVNADDVIWDIGANVGYYTEKFCNAVGPNGRVYAFEPVSSTAGRLRENVGGNSNLVIHMIAIGDRIGPVSMSEGSDDSGATSRIVETGVVVGTEVEMTTGDTAIETRLAEIPTVIKVDTEGYELEVLRGMPTLLSSPCLRAIFIEVHFGLLTDRGLKDAPAEIEDILRSNRFSVKWVDPSHISAVRN